MHPLTARLKERLTLPLIGAPLFLASTPDLVEAQCRAGIIGSFPSLNARPLAQLQEWLQRLSSNRQPTDAAFAVNLIVHKSNRRLDEDLEQVVRFRVPVVITSLGARPEVNDAVHSYGGIVLHDVIHNRFARKAIDKGADGLIAVAAGAGGHAGRLSPFALVQEIRAWFDGPLALSGAIASGSSILAAEAMGADFAYVGSLFLATSEANTSPAYRQALIDGTADDIVYTDFFTGIPANYLKASILASGFDPEHLPSSNPEAMNFHSGGNMDVKAWRDIWGAGQGIGAIGEILPAAARIARLRLEYEAARRRLLPGAPA